MSDHKGKTSKYIGVRIGRLVCKGCEGKQYFFTCDCGNSEIYYTGSIFHGKQNEYKTCGQCRDFKQWLDAGRPIKATCEKKKVAVSCYDCRYDVSYEDQKLGITCKNTDQKDDKHGNCECRVDKPAEYEKYYAKKVNRDVIGS